jgi:hypothetical protein
LLGPKKEILERQDDEERCRERPVIGAFGVGERDEFAQRRKRAEAEQHKHADAPG